jgi:transposase-like protein
MGKRKRFTPKEKVKVLREIFEGGKSVSTVAEGYDMHPNNIFTWRKQLFEGAEQIFEIKRPDLSAKAEGRKAAELEAKLKQKDEVIADLAEELLLLKKKSSGLR